MWPINQKEFRFLLERRVRVPRLTPMQICLRDVLKESHLMLALRFALSALLTPGLVAGHDRRAPSANKASPKTTKS
jgi:hypothetical protein